MKDFDIDLIGVLSFLSQTIALVSLMDIPDRHELHSNGKESSYSWFMEEWSLPKSVTDTIMTNKEK